MKNCFSSLKDNVATRKFGGTKLGVADPYVSGYFYVYFDLLPAKLADYVKPGNGQVSSNNEIQKILSATCLSVTPPGGTLSKVEFTGMGGIKWAVPGSIEYGTSVSVKFFEFNKTPLLDIFHGWIKMIRDYRTGVSNLIDGDTGEGYSKKTYACVMYYWTTAPDGQSVEYYACYDGVFPVKDPQDLFTSDVETVGRVDVEIEFNVDYAWHEPWVFKKCSDLTKDFTSAMTAVSKYGEGYK